MHEVPPDESRNESQSGDSDYRRQGDTRGHRCGDYPHRLTLCCPWVLDRTPAFRRVVSVIDPTLEGRDRNRTEPAAVPPPGAGVGQDVDRSGGYGSLVLVAPDPRRGLEGIARNRPRSD